MVIRRLLIGLSLLTGLSLLATGCGSETVVGYPGRDCSHDGVGCSPGFSCVERDGGGHSCVPQAADAAVPDETAPDADPVDANTAPDAETQPDGDGDGTPDTADNCPDIANRDQLDSDDDGLGDVCDAEPNIQNFHLVGHFLTLGGRSVDDDHTLRSRATTGAGESTDGQLILKGEFNP